MKNVLFLLFVMLLVFSCQKDEIIETNNEEMSITARGGAIELNTPTFGEVRCLADSLIQQDESGHFLNNLLDTLGTLRWDFSLWDGDSMSTTSIISVPFVKEEEVTAVLHYYTQNGNS